MLPPFLSHFSSGLTVDSATSSDTNSLLGDWYIPTEEDINGRKRKDGEFGTPIGLDDMSLSGRCLCFTNACNSQCASTAEVISDSFSALQMEAVEVEKDSQQDIEAMRERIKLLEDRVEKLEAELFISQRPKEEKSEVDVSKLISIMQEIVATGLAYQQAFLSKLFEEIDRAFTQ